MKKSEVFKEIASAMKAVGFRRRASNYEYVLDLGHGFEGWCSFADHAKRGSSNLLVATFAGVRCSAVEERIARWCGDVVPGWDGRSYVATVSANVGYLRPEAQWLEHPVDLTGDAPAESAQRNMQDVTGIALEFLRRTASYQGVTQALITVKGQIPDRQIERLPLTYALQGEYEKAQHHLSFMRKLVDDESYLAPRYLRYLAGFEEEFLSI